MTTEREILRQCLDYLALAGIFHWRSNTGAVRMPRPNGTTRFVRFGRRGIADVLGVLPGGRFLSVEVKSRTGELTDEQLAFGLAVGEAGGLALVVRSVEELARGLRNAGVDVPEVR